MPSSTPLDVPEWLAGLRRRMEGVSNLCDEMHAKERMFSRQEVGNSEVNEAMQAYDRARRLLGEYMLQCIDNILEAISKTSLSEKRERVTSYIKNSESFAVLLTVDGEPTTLQPDQGISISHEFPAADPLSASAAPIVQKERGDLPELLTYWRTFEPRSNERAAADIIERLLRDLEVSEGLERMAYDQRDKAFEEIKGLRGFKASVDEALNTGNGTYKP